MSELTRFITAVTCSLILTDDESLKRQLRLLRGNVVRAQYASEHDWSKLNDLRKAIGLPNAIQ